MSMTAMPTILYIPAGTKAILQRVEPIRLSDGDDIELLSENDMAELRKRLKTTTREEPQITMNVLIPVAGNMRLAQTDRYDFVVIENCRICRCAGTRLPMCMMNL